MRITLASQVQTKRTKDTRIHEPAQQQRSSNVGSQAVGSRRSGTEPPHEEIACAGCLWAPSMAERYNHRGHRGIARSWRDGARTVAGADRPRTSALANAAGCAALRKGTDGATAAVVSPEHKVAVVPRNKQLSTSHHFPATISPRHSTHPTVLIFVPFTVLVPSKLGVPLLQQCNMASRTSPWHFHVQRSQQNGHET